MTFDEHYFSTHTYKDVSFKKYSQYWWSNRFYAILRGGGDRNTKSARDRHGLGHLAGRLGNDFQTHALDVNPWAESHVKTRGRPISNQPVRWNFSS
jgi:hypothetical protein